jgi:hypothetical protein
MPYSMARYFCLITVAFPMSAGGFEASSSQTVVEAPAGRTRSQIYKATFDRIATKARPDGCSSEPVCTFFYCEPETLTIGSH